MQHQRIVIICLRKVVRYLPQTSIGYPIIACGKYRKLTKTTGNEFTASFISVAR